jgi:energy-coupling factor transporter transmembrane protein EcfT
VKVDEPLHMRSETAAAERSEFAMASVFFIIGGVLLALGVFYLIRPDKVKGEGLGGRYVTAPLGLVVLVIGILVLAFPFTSFSTIYKASPEVPPSQRTETSPDMTSQTVVPPKPPAVPIAFTSPVNESDVYGKFYIYGTAPDLNRDKLWLFIWAGNALSEEKVYYPFGDHPITIKGGAWRIPVGPLGSPIGTLFHFKLVRANPQCSTAITQIKKDSRGEIYVQTLPPGCSEVATLLVTKRS